MFFNLTIYIVVLIALRKLLRDNRMSIIFANLDRKSELKALMAFSFVMVAFFITWIPPFCNRLYESVTARDSGLLWLNVIQALTNPLQGFMNMALYGFRFLPQYKQLFCGSCGKYQVQIDEESPIQKEKTYGTTNQPLRVIEQRVLENTPPIKSPEVDTPDIIHVDHEVAVVVHEKDGHMHHVFQPMKNDTDSTSDDIDDGSSLPYSVMYQSKDGSSISGKSLLERHQFHRWNRSEASDSRQSIDGTSAYSNDGSVRIMFHERGIPDKRVKGGSGSMRFHKMYGTPSRYGSVLRDDSSYPSNKYDSDDSRRHHSDDEEY